MPRFLVFAGVFGCATGSLPEGEVDGDEIDQALRELSENPAFIGGCIDLIVFARNDDDTAGIMVHVDDGLTDAAEATGTVQEAGYVLPDPAVIDVEVLLGQGVTGEYCTDFGQQALVDHEAHAIGGRLDVVVAPAAAADPHATVTLEDGVFEDPVTGDLHELSFLELSDAPVGWLPGR